MRFQVLIELDHPDDLDVVKELFKKRPPRSESQVTHKVILTAPAPTAEPAAPARPPEAKPAPAAPAPQAEPAPQPRRRGRPPKNRAATTVLAGSNVPTLVEVRDPDEETPEESDSAPELPVVGVAIPATSEEAIAAAEAPSAPPPPLSAIQTALDEVLTSAGVVTAKAILARFGVARGRDVLPEVRQDFIDYCRGVVRGNIDPFAGEPKQEVAV